MEENKFDDKIKHHVSQIIMDIDNNYSTIKNIGLFNGKIGILIFVFTAAKYLGDDKLLNKAKELLNDLNEQISVKLPFNIENGLIGYALGISFLLKNGFDTGNASEILEEIDDFLFRTSCFNDIFNSDYIHKLDLTLYIAYRKMIGSDFLNSDDLFDDLVYRFLNDFSEQTKLNTDFFEEKNLFDVKSNWYYSLFILGLLLELNLHQIKVSRIIQDITPKITCKYPVLGSNRIYMYYLIKRINQLFPKEEFIAYLKILKLNINVEKVISEEFKTNSINIHYGICGFGLILQNLEELDDSLILPGYRKILIERILKSTFLTSSTPWMLQKFPNSELSLFNGKCGVAFCLILFLKKETKLFS